MPQPDLMPRRPARSLARTEYLSAKSTILYFSPSFFTAVNSSFISFSYINLSISLSFSGFLGTRVQKPPEEPRPVGTDGLRRKGALRPEGEEAVERGKHPHGLRREPRGRGGSRQDWRPLGRAPVAASSQCCVPPGHATLVAPDRVRVLETRGGRESDAQGGRCLVFGHDALSCLV